MKKVVIYSFMFSVVISSYGQELQEGVVEGVPTYQTYPGIHIVAGALPIKTIAPISSVSYAQPGPYGDGTYPAQKREFAPSPDEQQNYLLDFLAKGEDRKHQREALKAELEKTNVLAVAIAHDAPETIPQLLKMGATPQDVLGEFPAVAVLNEKERALSKYAILVYAVIDGYQRSAAVATSPAIKAKEIARGRALCALSRNERRYLVLNTGLEYLSDRLILSGARDKILQTMDLIRTCGSEGFRKVSKLPVYGHTWRRAEDGSYILDVPDTEDEVQDIPDSLLGPNLVRETKGEP